MYAVEQEREYLIALRRHFRKHPELSLKEYHTAEKIEQELDAIGIPNERVGETGVAAILRHITDPDTAKKIAKATAEMYGASVEIEFKDYTSPLINDEDAAAEVAELGAELLGKGKVLNNQPRNMLGDDFAEYLKEVKGQFLFVGCAGGKETSYPLHHEQFDLDENAILVATEFYVGYVQKIIGVE